jgi:hypothetical protein
MATEHIVIWSRLAGKTTAIKALKAIQTPALRACALCMHSAVPLGATDMACLCPTVIAVHGRTVTAQAARTGTGACGPDARHMDMHSWQQDRAQRMEAAAA